MSLASEADTQSPWPPSPDHHQIGVTTTYCYNVAEHHGDNPCPSWVIKTLEEPDSFGQVAPDHVGANVSSDTESSPGCEPAGSWEPGAPESSSIYSDDSAEEGTENA